MKLKIIVSSRNKNNHLGSNIIAFETDNFLRQLLKYIIADNLTLAEPIGFLHTQNIS